MNAPTLQGRAVGKRLLPHFQTFILVLMVLGLCSFARRASAQTNTATNEVTTPPAELKKLSLDELMNLDVTSVSKQPEPYLQAPAAIDVVTGDEIRRADASSIPEALRLADNLDVAQKNSHDWAISARGFNTDLANKLLVLMDGRTVYTPLFSGVFWDAQDYLLEDLDRIEVISGPGGTLWGANAVNGVINITTKSAKDTQGLYVEGGGGTQPRDFGGVRYGGTIASNVYFRVYGKYFDRGAEELANGDSATDSWRQGRTGFRMDADGSPGNLFTLQGDYYDTQENSTNGETGLDGENVLGRWSHVFSEDSATSLQAYYDRTHMFIPKAAALFEPAGNLTDSLDTYDLDFQHHFLLGDRNRVVWGLGYRFTHDVVGNAPTVEFLPPVLDQNLFSGFVQDEIKVVKDVFFTLGTKVEHNDYTGFEFEPSTRLQWNVTPKQMLWGAISRAVRTPSRIDRDLVEPTGLPAPFPGSVLNGSSDFISETLIAYELGYRAQFGSNVSGSISTFYNDYDNIRSYTPTPGPPVFAGLPAFSANNLEGETYGVEVGATWQVLEGWRLHGAYDLLMENIHVKAGQVDFSNGLNETADPKNQVSLRSSLDLPFQTELDTGLRWVDDLHVNNGPTPGIVPSYFELDARLGWRPNKWLEISIVGQNLLHENHPEYGFPDATQVQIGRSVYGKVACRF